jgi:ubiquinone/menaquinone biosynthesis C-methylase UbiE
MEKLRLFIARSAGTFFVSVSFLFPRLLETRRFERLMDTIFTRLAPAYDRLGRKLASDSVILGPLEAGLRWLTEPPRRAIDLACGTGLASFTVRERLPDTFLVAADLSEAMIRTMKSKGKLSEEWPLRLLVGNSAQLPFRGGSFDLVTLQNAPPYLEEMIGILRPGGSLILAYSFVFMPVVKGIVERRLAALGLEAVNLFAAETGMAVAARKSQQR